ncbi:MAG: hypothetical protein WC010_03935 [Candidatus Absconditabacterales bacterium]
MENSKKNGKGINVNFLKEKTHDENTIEGGVALEFLSLTPGVEKKLRRITDKTIARQSVEARRAVEVPTKMSIIALETSAITGQNCSGDMDKCQNPAACGLCLGGSIIESAQSARITKLGLKEELDVTAFVARLPKNQRSNMSCLSN